MPDQIYLLGNLVIMSAYAAISLAITVPLIRAGQVRSNKLATATALIFFSCAVGHGLHALMAYRTILGSASGMTHPGASWTLTIWDLLTAAVGVYYWTLRRGFGLLLGQGAIYVDPGGQHLIDEADARERAARASLAAIVEHIDDAIIGTTLDGTITAWNGGAERLFGYTIDDVLGQPVAVLCCVTSPSAGSRQAQALHKNGSRLDISMNTATIQDTTGAARGLSIVARDISSAIEAADWQRAVEERTNQAQRMESLGKLAGGVAHDFNNIMAIIVNYTEFADEQSAGNEAVRADLAQVRTAADRAINLTSQLLTFTRGDAVQLRDVDLNVAVREVESMLARTIGEHITLIAMPSADPLTVHADAGHIQQVLLNLAINARDSMSEGGTLVIESAIAVMDGGALNMQPPLGAGTYARLAVSDTGEGMVPEVAAHIFEPFYTTKPRGRGTGLGLSTVYGIVSEAGGSINVYSEPGVGTTFRVYLPLVAPSAETPGDPPRQAEPPRGDGRTVLVVEDESALVRVIARILTNGGYHVLAATGGPEALGLVAGQDFDLLLTDVIMPEMSGRRLAELLQQARPDLPVLFMSGYSNGLLGTTHILDDDIAFIEKPFTANGLLHKIDDVLTAAALA